MKKQKRRYVKRKITPDVIIKEVTRIRSRNNRNWMALVKLAVSLKPRKAKQILAQITKTDQDVTRWMSRL